MLRYFTFTLLVHLISTLLPLEHSTDHHVRKLEYNHPTFIQAYLLIRVFNRCNEIYARYLTYVNYFDANTAIYSPTHKSFISFNSHFSHPLKNSSFYHATISNKMERNFVSRVPFLRTNV